MNINNRYRTNFRIGKSKIHGYGVLTSKNVKKGEILGIAIYFKFYIIPEITTDFGRWINHSYESTSYLFYDKNKRIYYLIASRDLKQNEEITANYNHTPWFIKKPMNHYK